MRRDLPRLVEMLCGDSRHQGRRPDDQRPPARRPGAGTLRRRPAAHQRQPRHARPGPLSPADPPRRPGAGPRRHRGREEGRLRADQGQRRHHPRRHRDEVVPLARFAREHGLEMRFIEYMPIGAEDWERDKVYSPTRSWSSSKATSARWCRPTTTIRAPRPWISLRRRRRPRRHHRLGVAAVLHELQPRPPDRRRQAAQLPVRAGRGRRQAAAARRRPTTQIARRRSAATSRTSGKATRSTRPLRQAAADHARDRGISAIGFPFCETGHTKLKRSRTASDPCW